MSTPSARSATATTTGSNKTSKKHTLSVMLNTYLSTPPTITEELAFSGPQKRSAKKIVADRRKKAADYISNWEAEWEQKK
ncbi:hypothetical protein O988_01998 [Pseudogymnoascus sp. VKM F-3808]|nr:hypothetical protein O988_01998 [Pseudogymnoascus sp. VKM F-3808]